MCGAERWTDHRLLVSKLILRIQPLRRPQGEKLIKKLNVKQLRDKSVSEDLTLELECKLAELHLGQATIEEYWVVLRDKIHDTAFQLLGSTTRKNQDWFDENDEQIKEMLAEKNRLHRLYQLDQSSAAKKTAFTNIRRTVQTRVRKMQDSWLAAKGDAIQKYADTHDSKRFYDAQKEVYGPQSSSTSPLLNVDGTTLITTFIDLTKAFDTVCRDGLWQIMEKFGCTRKFTALVANYMTG